MKPKGLKSIPKTVFTARYQKRDGIFVGLTSERRLVFTDLFWRDPEHYAVWEIVSAEPYRYRLDKLAHAGCPDCIRLLPTSDHREREAA